MKHSAWYWFDGFLPSFKLFPSHNGFRWKIDPENRAMVSGWEISEGEAIDKISQVMEEMT